nr:uncharacterized protein LOC107445897 [Parasteatoda tepidariorum]
MKVDLIKWIILLSIFSIIVCDESNHLIDETVKNKSYVFQTENDGSSNECNPVSGVSCQSKLPIQDVRRDVMDITISKRSSHNNKYLKCIQNFWKRGQMCARQEKRLRKKLKCIVKFPLWEKARRCKSEDEGIWNKVLRCITKVDSFPRSLMCMVKLSANILHCKIVNNQ